MSVRFYSQYKVTFTMKAIRDAQLGTVSWDLIQGYWENHFAFWVLFLISAMTGETSTWCSVLPEQSFVFCWWSTTSSVAPVDWWYNIWNEVNCTAVVSRSNFTGHLLVVGVKCVIPNAQFAVIKRQKRKKNKQTNLIQTGMHVSMLRCCKHSYNLLSSDRLERYMFSDC